MKKAILFLLITGLLCRPAQPFPKTLTLSLTIAAISGIATKYYSDKEKKLLKLLDDIAPDLDELMLEEILNNKDTRTMNNKGQIQKLRETVLERVRLNNRAKWVCVAICLSSISIAAVRAFFHARSLHGSIQDNREEKRQQQEAIEAMIDNKLLKGKELKGKIINIKRAIVSKQLLEKNIARRKKESEECERERKKLKRGVGGKIIDWLDGATGQVKQRRRLLWVKSELGKLYVEKHKPLVRKNRAELRKQKKRLEAEIAEIEKLAETYLDNELPELTPKSKSADTRKVRELERFIEDYLDRDALTIESYLNEIK